MQSAEKLGKALGIPSLIIGLFIIAFGTSLPEFFVSHLAAKGGHGQIAIGNVVGSNISNLLLILGVSLLIKKITIDDKEIVKQMGIHLLLTLILSGILFLKELYVISCLVLLSFFVFFVGCLYRSMKEDKKCSDSYREFTLTDSEKVKLFIRLLLGFALLYYGGGSLVKVSTEICQLLGISEYVVSVIMIALGTSLPELMTSVLVVLRNRDPILIIGNIIGSNIFNIAFIMGSLFAYRIDLSRGFLWEVIVLVISSFVLWIYAVRRWVLSRSLGVGILLAYIAIVIYWI